MENVCRDFAGFDMSFDEFMDSFLEKYGKTKSIIIFMVIDLKWKVLVNFVFVTEAMKHT